MRATAVVAIWPCLLLNQIYGVVDSVCPESGSSISWPCHTIGKTVLVVSALLSINLTGWLTVSIQSLRKVSIGGVACQWTSTMKVANGQTCRSSFTHACT